MAILQTYTRDVSIILEGHAAADGSEWWVEVEYTATKPPDSEIEITDIRIFTQAMSYSDGRCSRGPKVYLETPAWMVKDLEACVSVPVLAAQVDPDDWGDSLSDYRHDMKFD